MQALYDVIFSSAIITREDMLILIDWLIDNNRETEANCWKFVYYLQKNPTCDRVDQPSFVWTSDEKSWYSPGSALPAYLFNELNQFYDSFCLTKQDAYIRLINAWKILSYDKRQIIIEATNEKIRQKLITKNLGLNLDDGI